MVSHVYSRRSGEIAAASSTQRLSLIAGIRVTRWSPTSLEADVLSGPPAEMPGSAVKAITYHCLRVVEEEAGWLAEYYVDV